jgi:hypothetical protein
MKNLKFALLFLMVATYVTAQKSVSIKYKPKVGSSLKTDMNMKMEMDMKMGEKNALIKMDMNFLMTYNALKRKKDVNSMELIFDRIIMKMSNPSGYNSYDSDIKDSSDSFSKKIGEGFNGVLGNPVPMKITTTGEFAEPIDVSKLFTQIPVEKAKELNEQMSNQFYSFSQEKSKSW